MNEANEQNARATVIVTKGDIVFIRDAARSFAILEQSLRERAAAAGIDDIDAHVRKLVALLLRQARAAGDEIPGARSYWLDADVRAPTEQDRLTAAEMKTRNYEVK